MLVHIGAMQTNMIKSSQPLEEKYNIHTHTQIYILQDLYHRDN